MFKPHWTEEEIYILKKYYGRIPKKELIKKLKFRTWSAIQHKTHRLGMKITNIYQFTHSVKPPENPVKKLSETEKAYIAGLIDGEGSILVTKRIRPAITVTNTNKDIIFWLGEKLGGDEHISSRSKGRKRKTVWRWGTTKILHIKDILENILPYLRIKKRHAELLLQFCNLKINGEPDNEKFLIIFEKLKKLNQKGKNYEGEDKSYSN